MWFVSWMIDNFYNLENLFRFIGPPDEFHVIIKFSTDYNEIFWIRQLKFCISGILRTKWTSDTWFISSTRAGN